LRIPLKARIGAKAEEIGRETEGDFTDNFIVFNSGQKRFQTGLPKYSIGMLQHAACWTPLRHQFCSKSCLTQ